MNLCSRCKKPVGDNGVFLTNGTHMCPSCFAMKYAPPSRSSSAPRIYISAEVVITILILVGIYVFSTKIYTTSAEHKRLEIVSQNERERFREDQIRAKEVEDHRNDEIKRLKETAEYQRLADIRDREAKEKLQREQQLIETAKARAEAARIERDKADKIADALPQEPPPPEPRHSAAPKPKFPAVDPASKPSAAELEKLAKERNLEIGNLLATIVDAKKKLTELEALKAPEVTKLNAAKVLLSVATSNRETLLKQYLAEFPRSEAAEVESITHWRIPLRSDKAKEYETLVQRFDDCASEVAKRTLALEKVSVEVAAFDAKINELKPQIDTAAARLGDLKASQEELMGLVSLAQKTEEPKLQPKKLILKDGSALTVRSYMIVNSEVHYKDEDGLSHVISKESVEKFK